MSSLFDEMMEEICEKNQKISDLEAKLAEKEDRINWLVEAEFNRKWAKKYVEMRRKEDPMLCLPDSDEVYERYFELKQQLAEKERQVAEYSDINNALNSGLQERCISCEEEHNQDKISFAVEQLEKVKNRIESKVESVYKRLDDLNIKIVCESTSRQLSTYEEIVKEIDNQIKAIKGDEVV